MKGAYWGEVVDGDFLVDVLPQFIPSSHDSDIPSSRW